MALLRATRYPRSNAGVLPMRNLLRKRMHSRKGSRRSNRGIGFNEGETDDKCRSVIAAFDDNCSTVSFDDFLCNVKSETCSAFAFCLEEGLKQVG